MEALIRAVLLVFGTYAVSYALIYLEGAWGSLKWLRGVKFIEEFGVLNCLACTSFWVSFVLTLFSGFHILTFLGVWGVVIFIDLWLTYRMLK